MHELLLVLALLSIFYLLGPAIFMATHRQPLPHMRPVAPGGAPAPVAQALARWSASFGEGMPLAGVHEITVPAAPIATLPFSEEHLNPAPLQPDPVAGYVLHFVDLKAGVHGLDFVTPRLRWQVFLTRFGEGDEVVTGNAPVAASAHHPRVHHVRFGRLADLRQLRALHDAHVRQAMGSRVPEPIPPDEALAGFVAQNEQRALERQRELGRMSRRGDVYQPTWKGAFLGTWRHLPPLIVIHAWRNARLAAALRRAVRGVE